MYTYFAVMENAEKGDLFEHILKQRTQGGLTVQTVLKIVRQLIDVLAYLHMRGVAHMDLKLENVLLD